MIRIRFGSVDKTMRPTDAFQAIRDGKIPAEAKIVWPGLYFDLGWRDIAETPLWPVPGQGAGSERLSRAVAPVTLRQGGRESESTADETVDAIMFHSISEDAEIRSAVLFGDKWWRRLSRTTFYEKASAVPRSDAPPVGEAPGPAAMRSGDRDSGRKEPTPTPPVDVQPEPPPKPPPSVEDLIAEGGRLAGNGQHREAVTLFDEVIKRDPRSIRAFTGKAQSLVQLGELQAGLESCKSALTLEPLNVDAYFAKGGVEERLHRTQDALMSYSLFLIWAPDTDGRRWHVKERVEALSRPRPSKPPDEGDDKKDERKREEDRKRAEQLEKRRRDEQEKKRREEEERDRRPPLADGEQIAIDEYNACLVVDLWPDWEKRFRPQPLDIKQTTQTGDVTLSPTPGGNFIAIEVDDQWLLLPHQNVDKFAQGIIGMCFDVERRPRSDEVTTYVQEVKLPARCKLDNCRWTVAHKGHLVLPE